MYKHAQRVSLTGKGNVTLCGEFNFVTDPESAYIVLEEFRCPTHIATMEYCCRNKLTWVSSRPPRTQPSPAHNPPPGITQTGG